MSNGDARDDTIHAPSTQLNAGEDSPPQRAHLFRALSRRTSDSVASADEKSVVCITASKDTQGHARSRKGGELLSNAELRANFEQTSSELRANFERTTNERTINR